MQKPIFETAKANFFAWAQMRQKTVVRLGDARKDLGLSPQQEKDLLSRMARSGIITRLTTGLYAVPPRLPLGGKWGPPEEVVLKELMEFYGGRYQLTGLAVFNRYGLSTQVANVTYAYNDKISGGRMIGNLRYVFIKVPKERLGGFTSDRVNFPTLGRAMMDAVYDWSRFNKLPKALEKIETSKNDRAFLTDLVDCALKYGNVATRRRIGYWFEKISADPKLGNRLLKSLKPTQAFIPLYPHKPKSGATNKRWGIVDNG